VMPSWHTRRHKSRSPAWTSDLIRAGLLLLRAAFHGQDPASAVMAPGADPARSLLVYLDLDWHTFLENIPPFGRLDHDEHLLGAGEAGYGHE